jgi:hypothetical protein
MFIERGKVNLDDEFAFSGDFWFRLGLNVLNFLDECSSSSSRTLAFDRKRQRERVGIVFLVMCKIMNGAAMIGAFYRLPLVILWPVMICHVYLDL